MPTAAIAGQADPALFEGLPSSVISDCMQRIAGTHGLDARHGDAALLGTAYTVRVRQGDNLYIHEALRHLQPGDVLVVDGGGSVERALVGEIMMQVARKRGCVGFVIDGAIRDQSAFRRDAFPCYAAGVTHRGPYKFGPGETRCAVTIGGVVVNHGDIVVGDEDGVVFIAPAQAAAVARAARAKLADEARTLADIAAGNYDDSWIDAALGR